MCIRDSTGMYNDRFDDSTEQTDVDCRHLSRRQTTKVTLETFLRLPIYLNNQIPTQQDVDNVDDFNKIARRCWKATVETDKAMEKLSAVDLNYLFKNSGSFIKHSVKILKACGIKVDDSIDLNLEWILQTEHINQCKKSIGNPHSTSSSSKIQRQVEEEEEDNLWKIVLMLFDTFNFLSKKCNKFMDIPCLLYTSDAADDLSV